MAFRITVEGLSRALSRLDRLPPEILESSCKVIFDKSRDPIFTESQRLVPIDTGALQDTGRVHPPVRTKFTCRVDITYGGFSAKVGKQVEYARVQHEKFPKKRKPGRTWQYLRKPFRKHTPKVLESIVKANKEVLRKIYS